MDPSWARAIRGVHSSPRLWIEHMTWRPRGASTNRNSPTSELCTLQLEGRGQRGAFREHLLCVCTCWSFSGFPGYPGPCEVSAHYIAPSTRLAHRCHSLEGYGRNEQRNFLNLHSQIRKQAQSPRSLREFKKLRCKPKSLRLLPHPRQGSLFPPHPAASKCPVWVELYASRFIC